MFNGVCDGLKLLRFDELNVSRTVNPGCKLVGCVSKCYNVQPSKQFGKQRKLLIRDVIGDGTLGDKQLYCVFYSSLVDRTRNVTRDDYLTLTDFEVIPDPTFTDDLQENYYPFLLDILEKTHDSITVTPMVIVSEMPKLSFDNLSMICKRYAGACIIGCVVRSSRMEKSCDKEPRRKLVLKELLSDGSLGRMQLDCILYSQLTTKYKHVKEGDTVKVHSFEVEARPSTSALEEMRTFYPYQIVLHPPGEDSYDDPSICIVKASEPKSITSTKPPSHPKQPAYCYTLLNDLKINVKNGCSSRKTFNVYGIVVYCTLLNSRFKRCLQVDVRDPSLDLFKVFVYTRPDSDEFPDIRPKDIIRFHRLSLEYQRNTLQGFCYSPKDVVVFSGTDPKAKASHTSRSFTFTDSDAETVDRLRDWGKPRSSTSEGWKSVSRKVKQGQLHELIPQENAESQDVEIIAVRASSNKIQVTSSRSQRSSPRKDVVNHDQDIQVLSPRSQRSPRKDLANHDHNNNNTRADDLNGPKRQREDQPRACVMVNKRARINGENYGKVMELHTGQNDKNKNIIMFETDSEIEAENYDDDDEPYQIVDSGKLVPKVLCFDPKVMTGNVIESINFVSTVTDTSAAVTLIKDLETAEAYSRNRVQARVVQMDPLPSNAEDSIHLFCKKCHYIISQNAENDLLFLRQRALKLYFCPKCMELDKMSILYYGFVFTLQLDDGSSRINVYLYNENAEFFLNGIKAAKCCIEDSDALKTVKEKLSSILFSPQDRQMPPVLDCCLFSFYSNTGKKLQIVDTKLL